MKYSIKQIGGVILSFFGAVWLGMTPLTFAAVDTPSLVAQPPGRVDLTDTALKIIFGPLPAQHTVHDHVTSPMLMQTFVLPRAITIVGYRASVLTKEGSELPLKHLHHISVLNMSHRSTFCEGGYYLLAGTGAELREGMFPRGFGVTVPASSRLLTVGQLYSLDEKVDDVIVTFELILDPDGRETRQLDTVHISVTADCYEKLASSTSEETDQGLILRHGWVLRSVPVHFGQRGCVRYAHAHAHDYIVLMLLENKTRRRTLIRNVPEVSANGALQQLPWQHLHAEEHGFEIDPLDEYELTMAYHRPLQDSGARYAMGSYLLYFTQGPCLP